MEPTENPPQPSVPRAVQLYLLHRKKRKQNDSTTNGPKSDCQLLRLPMELVLKIAEKTEPAERTLLSQTCRPLRAILRRYGTAQELYASIKRRLYVEFLYTVVRDRPDAWACDACFCLHRVNYVDTPRVSPWDPEKMLIYGETHYRRRMLVPGLCSGFSQSSDHLVQLTLRLLRLQTICSPLQYLYLQRLLEPYSTVHRSKYFSYRAMCFPKAVDIEGSLYYMVRCDMRLDEHQSRSFPPCFTAPLDLCHHQELKRYRQGLETITQILPGTRLGELTGTARYNLADPATAAAIHSGGGCKECLTDFAIKQHDALGNDVTLTVWQCFGTETAPSGILWRAWQNPSFQEYFQVPGPNDWGPIVPWGSDRLISRQAGWVRDSYEGQDTLLPALELPE